jgi:hypothetical protein
MRAKVAKRISELVPDTVVVGRKAKKKAWNKLRWKEKTRLSSASKKENSSADKPIS